MKRNSLISAVVFLWIVLFFLTLGGCGDKAETSDKRINQSIKVKWVKVSPLNSSPPKGSIEYVGVLTAHRRVNVASEIGGTIERLYFEKGDRVRQGQALAEVSTSRIRLEVQHAEAVVGAAISHLEKVEKGSRPEEISIAEALLDAAEAAFIEAEKNFKRVRDLYKYRAISDSELDSAKRQVDMASAKVESARHQLVLARQGPRIEDRKTARANLGQAEAALALAKDRLKKSRINAPCDGIIAFREVEEGEVIIIPPGQTITQVVDLSSFKIRVSVGEKDIHILRKYRRFEFTIDAVPQERFFCLFSFLSPAADPVTRSFPVEFMVEKPDERMADGMTVRVTLPIEDDKKAVKVPSAWLSEKNGRIGLFVVRNGKALFKDVKLGAYYDQRVEILSGLGEQDLVITNPAGLKSGDAIKY
jgi:multidrug efflux pump subunit AcrA (membrane-fusion protein)